MRPLLGRLLAGLLPLLPLSAMADPVGYVVGFDTLYRMDLATGQSTAVGPIGFADVEGLAMASDGRTLFGVSDAGVSGGGAISDLLIRIDIDSGAGTLVGPLQGLQGLGPGGNLDYGLAFTADGRLWLSSDTLGTLWEVSAASGVTRLVGRMDQSISGLAARSNELYGISVDAAPRLFRIDTATAAATAIGALNVGGVVADAGLDFDAAGVLWAVLDPEPSAEGASRVARINLTTGAGTIVSSASIASVGMEGLALAPTSLVGGGNGGSGGMAPTQVPGPGLAMLALLALLASGLGLRRLRPA